MIIDNEFRNLIPALTNTEYAGLRESIIQEGIRDTLIIWNDTLLDGHNRYKIAQELGLQFQTKSIELPNREAAKQWIITNQLSRRNLTEQQASYLRGKLYEANKLNWGGNRGNQYIKVPSGQNGHLAPSEEIAKQYGVAEHTIRRDATFATAVDKVAEVIGEDAKNGILSGVANVPKKDVLELIDIHKEAPEFIKPIINGDITLSEVKREIIKKERITKIVENTIQPLDSMGKFPVIYADPPWRYHFPISISRDIENQYPTMSLDDICNMNISAIANDDCILFLWATNPKLSEALQVIEAWGFEYKTNLVWIKDKLGMGYYVRQQHELLLIATKGNLPLPDESNRVSSIIEAKRTEHSKKPECVYDIIENMYPEYPKIELFARTVHSGWKVWGNQI